jgi:nucleoside phosphorylase
MTVQLASFGLVAKNMSASKTTAPGARTMIADTITVLEPLRTEDIEGRVVIVTAKNEEFDAFLSFPDIQETRAFSIHNLRIATRPGNDILVVTANEMGNVVSALTTKLAIDKWNPGLVLLAGITGGFQGSVEGLSLGDVLVPGVVVGYDQEKVTPDERRCRVRVASAGTNALAIANEVDNEDTWFTRPGGTQSPQPPRVHLNKAVFSGEEVVADLVEVAQLRSVWGDAIGTEMEGIGLMIAAYRDETRPEALVVKAVSDWADPEKGDSHHENAASNSARFAMAVAEKWVERYRTASRHPLQLQRIKDANGFCRRLDDEEAIELAIEVGIDQHVYNRWKKGVHARKLIETVEQRGLFSKLIDAVLRFERSDLIPYLY